MKPYQWHTQPKTLLPIICQQQGAFAHKQHPSVLMHPLVLVQKVSQKASLTKVSNLTAKHSSGHYNDLDHDSNKIAKKGSYYVNFKVEQRGQPFIEKPPQQWKCWQWQQQSWQQWQWWQQWWQQQQQVKSFLKFQNHYHSNYFIVCKIFILMYFHCKFHCLEWF